jgi:hypothetical protein
MIAATTETEVSEVGAAQLSADAAQAAYTAWSERRQATERTAADVAAKLATVSTELQAARLAAVETGEPIPEKLLARRRALQDELAEAGERVAVAKAAELDAHAVHATASQALSDAQIVAQSAAMIAKAAELDGAIDEAIGTLYALLAERWEIEQTGSRGFGMPRLPLRFEALPHAHDRHGMYPGLGGE